MSEERKTQHAAPTSSASAGQDPALLNQGQAGSSGTGSGTASGTAAASTAEIRSEDGAGTSSDAALQKAPEPAASGVYFFPDRVVTEDEARKLLASKSKTEQAEVVSRLLTYAEYDEIWTWTDRETVRELFDQLDMPDRLRAAWARNLGLEAKA